jgi:uncharacterized repeat protein (TIGR03803 family)
LSIRKLTEKVGTSSSGVHRAIVAALWEGNFETRRRDGEASSWRASCKLARILRVISTQQEACVTTYRLGLFVSAACIGLSVQGASAQVTYEVVGNLDASGGVRRPLGGVIKVNGALYGTGYEGGASPQCGGIYRIAPDGTLTIIHTFNVTDGCNPVGELAVGADGHLYGTTQQGGPNTDASLILGTGTIFRVSIPDETFSMIHAFAARDPISGTYPEGFWPYSGLTLGNDNKLYGITNGGGTSNGGTIFRIASSGPPEVLYALEPNTDGQAANAGLTLGSDGHFYGTTALGGGIGATGTVFRFTPGAFEVLFTFTQDHSCGCYPNGSAPMGEPVDDGSGNLFGTTSGGGPLGMQSGTIWRLSSSGQFTVLKAFTGAGSGIDGSFPSAGLTLGSDGNLYGTTSSGGANSNGTAFRITPTGTHDVLHSFGHPIGVVPDGRLIEPTPGVFFGTTQLGGTSGGGVVFQLTLSAPTTTNLTVSPGAVVAGQPLTLTALVSSAGGTPTGLVEYFDGTTSLGTAPLNGGTAVLMVALAPGTHTLSATYKGGGGFTTSTSAGQQVVVTKAQTSTLLASSPNPSRQKQIVTITVTVAPVAPGAGTPTGQVRFTEGKKKLGAATLANGVALLSIAFTKGTHVVTAAYDGDGNFLGGGGSMTQTVTR